MNIELGDLPVGTYRDVTPEEYQKLQELIQDSYNDPRTRIIAEGKKEHGKQSERNRSERYKKKN